MLTKKYTPLHSAIASLRFGTKCFNCQFDNPLYLELDHYVAKSKGGKSENFILLCSRCNKSKGTMAIEKWLDSPIALTELDAILSVEFTAEEIFSELIRLVKIEMDFANNSKALNHKLSTSASRAKEMKGYKRMLE